MAFKDGDARPENAGRKAGTPNKRTVEIQEYAASRGVSPANFCIDLIAGDAEAIGKEVITFEDKKWAIELLFPYLYGKRKPVDSKGDDSDSLVSLFLGQLNDRG
jgi:hypothetical protein